MEELQTIKFLDTPKNNTSPVQSLTRESLFWLNLENETKNKSSSDYNTTITEESSTFELTSSSSSIGSYDSTSEEYKHVTSNFYGTANTSNSSIGTLVYKQTSSSSTLNLESRSDQSIHSLSDQNTHDSIDTKSLLSPFTPIKVPRKIKSSLKLPGLIRSKSMPNAVAVSTATGSAKTVRFSNDLTRIKTFNEYSTPSAISLDNSPEASLPALNNAEHSMSQQAVFDLKNYFNSSSSSSSDDDKEDDDYFNYRLKFQSFKWSLRYLNFNMLDDELKDERPVKLKSLSIVNNYSLVGTVHVANYAFEKYVEVKFTMDNWKSIYLITAQYQSSLSPTKDQFKFEISLPKSFLLSAKPKASSDLSNEKFIEVGLCIKYVCSGRDHFYDNNNNQNYQLELVNKPIKRIRHHRRYNSEDLNSSLNTLSGFNNRLNLNIKNFKITSSSLSFSSLSKPSPAKSPSSSPLTSSFKLDSNYTSTRYFSDETDYFNSSPIKNSNLNNWLESSSVKPRQLQSYLSTLSSSTITPECMSSGSSSSSNFPVKKTDKQSEAYDDFLKKYCFFKTPTSNEQHEAVFIL